MSAKRKWLLGCGCLFASLFAVFLTVILILTASIFDKEPKLEQNWQYDLQACIDLQEQFKDIAFQMINPLAVIPPEKEETLIFDETQVNSIIFIGVNRDHINELMLNPDVLMSKPDTNYDFYYKDGRFFINYALKTPIWTPFGSYINVTAEFIPIINDKEKKLIVKVAKVGSVPLPNSVVKMIENFLLNKLTEKEENVEVLNVVSSLKVENGKLVVVYKPAALRIVMMKMYTKMLSQ